MVSVSHRNSSSPRSDVLDGHPHHYSDSHKLIAIGARRRGDLGKYDLTIIVDPRIASYSVVYGAILDKLINKIKSQSIKESDERADSPKITIRMNDNDKEGAELLRKAGKHSANSCVPQHEAPRPNQQSS